MHAARPLNWKQLPAPSKPLSISRSVSTYTLYICLHTPYILKGKRIWKPLQFAMFRCLCQSSHACMHSYLHTHGVNYSLASGLCVALPSPKLVASDLLSSLFLWSLAAARPHLAHRLTTGQSKHMETNLQIALADREGKGVVLDDKLQWRMWTKPKEETVTTKGTFPCAFIIKSWRFVLNNY